jgi:hypothetical protein
MDEITLNTLVDEIVKRAKAVNFQSMKVEKEDHGYGWEPTMSLNCDDRRVHFYFNFFDHDRLTVEVSWMEKGNPSVMRTAIASVDDAWSIVDSFLRQQCPPEELPSGFQWEQGAHGRSH